MLLVIFGAVCILVILYKYLYNNNDYWKKRNVPYDPPVMFFGSLRDSIIMKRSLGQIYTDMYNKYKDVPYVGFYKIRKPAMLLRDSEIIKNVLIKDFHNFEKNDIVVDEKIDPIFSRNPFSQYGERWKVSRSQLSYCFTSGKMKHMFPLMQAVSQNMTRYIENEIKLGGNPMDTKELSEKFTCDNVASCAFGLDGQAFEDPNSEFRRIGKQILQPSFMLVIKFLILMLFPECNKLLRIRFLSSDIEEYFRNIIKHTLEYRKKTKLVRNDFLDVITQMKFKPNEPALGEDDITAHAISFFGDGFETSSVALSFALYSLATNLGVQEKLRNEIYEVLKRNNGNLTYEAIQSMHYLDCVLSESLRLYPPALFLSKICTADYNLPPCTKSNNGIKLEKDTPVVIPIYALHRDAKYFPNPEKFDPDRFSDSNKSNILKGSYLPFGEGGRLCLGMKFAILQVKFGIVSIVQNFNIRLNEKTKEPLTIDPKSFLLWAKGGLWLDYYKRNM